MILIRLTSKQYITQLLIRYAHMYSSSRLGSSCSLQIICFYLGKLESGKQKSLSVSLPPLIPKENDWNYMLAGKEEFILSNP